jgi:hypothetical protein
MIAQIVKVDQNPTDGNSSHPNQMVRCVRRQYASDRVLVMLKRGAGMRRRRLSTGFAGRLAAAVLALVPLPGCSRGFWRQQADQDSYQAIAEHIVDPRWAVPRFDLTPDPRSRFFDPYDPDAAPLPPDDPAAHVYMHWVDGWEGYKGWHKFGDLMSVENPQWLANFGISTEAWVWMSMIWNGLKYVWMLTWLALLTASGVAIRGLT